MSGARGDHELAMRAAEAIAGKIDYLMQFAVGDLVEVVHPNPNGLQACCGVSGQ